MSTRLNTIETKLKTKAALVIGKLADKYGITVDIRKKVEDVYSSVYGANAGTAPEGGAVVTKNVLFVRDDFSVMDLSSIGTLVEGYIYEAGEDIEVGDTVIVKRDDSLLRQFQVSKAPESMGNTTSTLRRAKVSSIGE